MCGIAGWAGGGRAPFSEGDFSIALDTLRHRGPDDRGLWSGAGVMLGHRRLSIIDLSPAGHQPMLSAQTGSALVFNGEIYNYVELREELARGGIRPAGGSDTGVLLAAFDHWGPDALSRLNGMWAFGLWRPGTRQLVLARDRFGVKPLYYRVGADGLAFASEPKALLALYPQHRALDRETLIAFLAHNDLYGHNRSFYEGIHLLPPGHYAVYDADAGRLRVERFWDYPAATDVAPSLALHDASETFNALFEDAVRIRLRSDVPVGITLSGGLDSTAVLAAAARHAQVPPRCYTSVYGLDSASAAQGELSWARIASDAAGAPLTPVPAPRGDWLKVMHQVVWHMDGPGYSPAVYPLWRLMQRAREDGVPVLLEGQGADEVLAGYPQYAVLELLSFLRQGGWTRPGALSPRLDGLRGTFSWRWALAWIARETLPWLLSWHRRRAGFQSLLRDGMQLLPPPVVPAATDTVRQRLLHDHGRAILPGLLHYGDAVSMAHGIEARHPFMDYRLVEWLFKAPTSIKLNDGQTKWVLREYLRAKGQAAIGNRRDKKGYPTPAGEWLASAEGREIEAAILCPGNRLHEWCEPGKLSRLFEQNRRGVLGTEHHVYKLASTQMWMDRCLTQQDVPA